MSGGVVCVTLLLGAERLPFEATVTTVYVVVRPGQSFESEIVVRGGSTRRHPSPFLTTQYHQLVELLFVAAFQASEMLVSELDVIRRFVGPLDPPPPLGGGGFAAGAAETATRAKPTTTAAKTGRRGIEAPPEGAGRWTAPRKYERQAETDFAAAAARTTSVITRAGPARLYERPVMPAPDGS